MWVLYAQAQLTAARWDYPKCQSLEVQRWNKYFCIHIKEIQNKLHDGLANCWAEWDQFETPLLLCEPVDSVHDTQDYANHSCAVSTHEHSLHTADYCLAIKFDL